MRAVPVRRLGEESLFLWTRIGSSGAPAVVLYCLGPGGRDGVGPGRRCDRRHGGRPGRRVVAERDVLK